MVVNNNDFNNAVVRVLDVFDSTDQVVIGRREIKRQDFLAAGSVQKFAVEFTSPGAHALEFRVFATCAEGVRHRSTEIQDATLEHDMLTWMHSQLPGDQ